MERRNLVNEPSPHAVYLDYNATTPVAPDVLAAMAPYWADVFFNPSAPYATAAHAAVEAARASVAELLGATPDEIVFTSGGTESDLWALRAGLLARRAERPRVVISAIEHPAVTETAHALERAGAEVTIIPVDDQGRLRLEALDAALDTRTAIVSVMLANNEIGVIQPIAEIARRAHAVGAWMHTDAAQAVGKLPVDVQALGVDLLTVAGHKLYAPKGIGALYIRQGVDLAPLMTGGGQERGRRSGTENVPSIVGLGEAAREADRWLAGPGPERQTALRDALEIELLAALPGARVFGQRALRLPNTCAIAVPHWTGAALLAACPSIQASTGSACHGVNDSGSPTLRALGVEAALARGLIRLSLGRATTHRDVETAVAALVAAANSRASHAFS